MFKVQKVFHVLIFCVKLFTVLNSAQYFQKRFGNLLSRFCCFSLSLFKCCWIFVRFVISIVDKNQTLKFEKKLWKSRVEVDRNSETIQRIQCLRNFGRRFPLTCRRLLSVAFNLTLAFTNIKIRLEKTEYFPYNSQAKPLKQTAVGRSVFFFCSC